MIFNWYKIFNIEDFEANLVSKTFTVNLSGVGLVDIIATRGILLSITYDGVLLPVMFEGENPFIGLGGQYAVYKDADDNIYLGFKVEEE